MSEEQQNGNGFKERINIHERLATLETQVETIMTNHLPHIQASITNISQRVEGFNVKLWGLIVALVINLIVLLIKKI